MKEIEDLKQLVKSLAENFFCSQKPNASLESKSSSVTQTAW